MFGLFQKKKQKKAVPAKEARKDGDPGFSIEEADSISASGEAQRETGVLEGTQSPTLKVSAGENADPEMDAAAQSGSEGTAGTGPKTGPEVDKQEQDRNGGVPLDVGQDDKSVGEILDFLINDAVAKQASDIHIEPREDKVVVRYHIDGLLRDVLTVDKNMEEGLVFKIKVSARLRTDEHFAPQDGRIRFKRDGKKLDTRISILPTTRGEKVVIRILSKEGKTFSLEELGVAGKEFEVIAKSYKKPYGMIIASGPTGSGKTTTLYSILKLINSPDKNITTIEDPVEYDLPGVNHVQVNPKADMTFANGLRSLLRQDPDIMMIGEVRDAETANIAINAAMTGHLVLSTLHTNDSVTTIPRLIDMGVKPYLIASTVNVVIAQRLVRKLCDGCKKPRKLTAEENADIDKFRPDLAKLLKVGETIYEKTGCAKCSETGYKGRVGLFEILEITKEIRKQIIENPDVDIILDLAKKQGLQLIVEDGVEKLRAGVITLEEILRVTTTND